MFNKQIDEVIFVKILILINKFHVLFKPNLKICLPSSYCVFFKNVKF